MSEKETNEKEYELVKRINKLDMQDLRAILYSIKDIKTLEDMVKVGEEYHKAKNI